MYFRITTICAFIAFSFALFSQTPKKWNELLDDPEVTLTQLRVAFEQEWTGKVRAKGQGYNQFKRFEYFAAPRVYPSDKIGILKETYFEHQIIQNQKKSIPSKSSKVWKEVGPNTVPTQGGGAGRLTFIEFHPNNVDEIYVGTPNGGLWKSMNGGVSWTNSNDYLSVIGCSDLEIDPTDPNVMYLATGDNDHVSTSSVGVLKSTNGGATWISTGLT